MVPLTRVPFWYHFFEPQPFNPLQVKLLAGDLRAARHVFLSHSIGCFFFFSTGAFVGAAKSSCSASEEESSSSSAEEGLGSMVELSIA